MADETNAPPACPGADKRVAICDGVAADWDEYVTGHRFGLIYHTSAWGQALQQTGREIVTIVAHDGDRITGGAMLSTRHIRLLGRAAECVGGILVDFDSADQVGATVDSLLAAMRDWASRVAVGTCDITMRIPAQVGADRFEAATTVLQCLHRAGLKARPETVGTYLQQINLSDALLLQSLGKNCRRDVRRARRDGVVIENTTANEALESFYGHYQALCVSKGLDYAPASLVIRGLERVFRRGAARLFVARLDGEVVNSAIVSTIGIPRYLFGATALAALHRRPPPTGQLLHYEIMRWQRDHGARFYDWGGSPGPTPDSEHPNYGVWRFKHSFGGTYVEYLGRWLWILRPIRHRMLISAQSIAVTARRTLRAAARRTRPHRKMYSAHIGPKDVSDHHD